MPGTTVEPGGSGPYDRPVEPRVSRLEEQMSDLKPILARIEAVLPHLATAAQVAELKGDLERKFAEFAGTMELKHAQFAGSMESKQAQFAGSLEAKLAQFAGDFNAKLERLTGRVESLPTTWQMITAIIAGQITFAGVLCAAVFGAARLTGHL
jgi:hypothetical protein